jgi:hypothetical protein
MCTGVEDPPEGVDPGQWALDQYRAWRSVHMGSRRTPPSSSMEELMASMREEPPRE